MEIGTGLALFGVAKLIEKLLGPTADYIGKGIKTLAEKRVNNIKEIFSVATKRVGSKIETEGMVPPKVLKGILDEASFCDDFLSIEYFGGVLASSRSGISRDDRGVSFISLISRLSTYQIRTHYICYHILKNLFDRTSLNVGVPEGRNKMEIYVPESVYCPAMDFDQAEMRKLGVILAHTMFGLEKENLIESFRSGRKEMLQEYFKKATEAGLIFGPSCLGIELFLWAYGKSDLPAKDFFNLANRFEIDSKVNIPSGYQKIRE